MNSQDLVIGLPSFDSITPPFCSKYAFGKSHRTHLPINTWSIRMHRPGLFFHVDISGPFQVQSYGGHYYFITYKDDHSSYCSHSLWRTRRLYYPYFWFFINYQRKKRNAPWSKLRTNNGRECWVPLHKECPKHYGHKGDLEWHLGLMPSLARGPKWS